MLLDEMESDTEGVSANIRNMAEATGKMKQFASWFTHGVTGGGALRKAIYEAKSGDQILSAVESFFECAREKDSAPEAVASIS
jgi:tRNA-dihydrouridine synthase